MSLSLPECLTELGQCVAVCGNTSAPTNAPTFDPCGNYANYLDSYELALHVGAIFIIMCTSLVGVTSPLLLKRTLRGNKETAGYYIACGKLVGTGVVLACGLVHMLQPAAVSLTTAGCVPFEFSDDYNAYAYLFAMLAMILMHLMENVLRVEVFKDCEECEPPNAQIRASDVTPEKVPLLQTDAHFTHVRRQVQTIAMEFGLTMHSVFVGLLVGVTGDVLPNGSPGFSVLLVALGFHQFFEGVALGARLADVEASTQFIAAFILVFVLSCPVGIACGIGYVTSVNPQGETMLLVQGTFDGVCGGLLLYVGTQLMHIDFPNDMTRFCPDKDPHAKLKRFGMFLSLWVGAGFMAYIGKYL